MRYRCLPAAVQLELLNSFENHYRLTLTLALFALVDGRL